jgi:hypothetical protein
VDFDTPNARNASGRGGRTAAFKFYEIPDNLPRTDRHGSKEAEFAIAVMENAGWKPRGKRFKRG